jgi:hypothetical protein
MPYKINSVALKPPSSTIQDNDNRNASVRTNTLISGSLTATGVGDVIDLLDATSFRAELDISSASGTNPTLDVSLITSDDGKEWRALGTAFTQETGAWGSLSAVTSSGTTPPAITISGTPVRAVNFKATVGTIGARGTAVLKISLDGGRWYYLDWTTAATYTLLDEDGVSTGIALAYANASAASDNVWTFRTLGKQRASFSGAGRYVRAVYTITGTDTPTFATTLKINTYK